jgi:hypothetical protein
MSDTRTGKGERKGNGRRRGRRRSGATAAPVGPPVSGPRARRTSRAVVSLSLLVIVPMLVASAVFH